MNEGQKKSLAPSFNYGNGEYAPTPYTPASKTPSLPLIFKNNHATNARITLPRIHEYFCQLPKASCLFANFVHPTKHNIKKMFGALNKME